jgi:hypothetical protein
MTRRGEDLFQIGASFIIIAAVLAALVMVLY